MLLDVVAQDELSLAELLRERAELIADIEALERVLALLQEDSLG